GRSHRRAQRRGPAAGRDGPGDLAERAGPVEAAVDELLDGLLARLAQLRELRVGLELGGLRLGRVGLRGRGGKLAALGVQRPADERVRRGHDDEQREDADERIRADARASAAAGGLLDRDQVDGLHAGASSMASPAATARRPASKPAGAPSTAPVVTGRPSSEDRAASKPGMADAGPETTARSTTALPPWAMWKSSELRTSAAMRRAPSSRTRRAVRTMVSSPSMSSTASWRPTCSSQPRAWSSVSEHVSASSMASASTPPPEARVKRQAVPLATARFVRPPIAR